MLHSLRILPSLLTILILLAACGPGASRTADAPAEEERLRVVTSVSPIANIIYNIGGDRIDLVGIMPPGTDPHTFEPRPSDAVKLAQADLIFLNGMHLDESTLRLAEANLKEGAEIIELAAAAAGPDELLYGIEHHHGHGEVHDDHDDEDEESHAEEEGHDDDDDEHGQTEEEGHDDDGDEGHAEEEGHDDDGDEGHAEEEGHDDDGDEGHAEEEGHDDDGDEGLAEEEGHDDDGDEGLAEEEGHDEDDDEHGLAEEEGEPDPHLLLDPNFAIRYAKVVFVSLAAHDPDNRDFYEANFNEYTARLLALDEAIRAATATIPESNRRLLTYHDSFGYFAIRYGYIVIGAIQPSDTAQPSAQEVVALIEQLLAEGVPAIFGSALFPADVLDQIASETGATVSTLLDEDLPGQPGDPEHTYIGMMVENMRTLASVLGGDPSLMDGVEVGNVPDSQ